MRTFALVLLASSLALFACKQEPAPPPPPAEVAPPGPVAFGREAHVVGERFIDSVTTSLTRTDAEALDSESRLVTQVEVLETTGEVVESVEVTYAEESDVDRLAGKGVRGPMRGKRFLVSATGDELSAKELGDADAGVSMTELGRLRTDFAWLGKPDRWRAAVQSKTLRYHEHSLPVARALADTMTVGWAESTATASARYLGHDGGVADFEVTVDQTMNASQPRRSQAKLTGSLQLRVHSGDFASLALDGPVQFWEGGQVVGAARMKLSSRRQTSADFAARQAAEKSTK